MTKRAEVTQRALLAGLFAPGAGQAVQGRYVAAIVWAIVFLIPCSMFFWLAAHTIIALYDFALHFDTASPPAVVPKAMIATFVAAILVYVASLADVHKYSRRPR